MPNYRDAFDAAPIYPLPQRPAPQDAPAPTRQLSVFAYLRLLSSLVLVAAFICIETVALLITFYLITQGLGNVNVVNAFSRINPAGVIGAIVNPITSIPATRVWCKAIGIGCGPDRHAAFKTEEFRSLEPPPSTEQISIGTDFFDCLNDLRIARQQENGTSHLPNLCRKVMQFEHLLEAPEDLRDNLAKLAGMKKEVLSNASTARVSGSNGVRKIIDECAINIEDFDHQIERAFSLQEPSEELSIDDQLEQLVPPIEGLQTGLDELKRKDEAERQAIAGATAPSLLPAEIDPSLGEAGVGERKKD